MEKNISGIKNMDNNTKIILKKIENNKIEITKFLIYNISDGFSNNLNIEMEIFFLNEFYSFEFYNVDIVVLKNISSQFMIEELEILDNTKNGWESNHKYTIKEFDDGDGEHMCFYCEDISLIQKS